MTSADIQRRFHQLGADKAAIRRKSAPVHHIRDAIRERVNVLERHMKPLTDAIKTIEAPVFEIDMERARLARALSGKTGAPPPSNAGDPVMTDAEIAELLRSLKINSAVAVPVSGGKAEPDGRIDAVMDALRELAAKVNNIPPPVDPSKVMETVYADLKTFARAVQAHDAVIAEIKADIGIIKDDLGVFVCNLEAKA